MRFSQIGQTPDALGQQKNNNNTLLGHLKRSYFSFISLVYKVTLREKNKSHSEYKYNSIQFKLHFTFEKLT